MKRVIFLISLLFFLFNQSSSKIFSEIINLPWCLINVWWDMDQKVEFKTLEVDFEIISEVPDGFDVFIAPVGSFYLNNITLYSGVQPGTSGYKDKKETSYSKRIVLNKHGGIFSRWDERDPSAIKMAEGGFAESAGYEGNFVSVRNVVPWTKGRYTLKLYVDGKTNVHGKPHTWVTSEVRIRNKAYKIGSLAFPGDKLMITGSVSNFIEIYGRQIDTKNIPNLKFIFHWPYINGEKVKASVWSGHQLKFPVYARGRAKNGAVEVEIGPHFGKKHLQKGDVYYWEYLYK